MISLSNSDHQPLCGPWFYWDRAPRLRRGVLILIIEAEAPAFITLRPKLSQSGVKLRYDRTITETFRLPFKRGLIAAAVDYTN